MPETTTQPQPAQGGSYVVNPATGQPELVSRTAEPAPQLCADPADAAQPAAGTEEA